MIEEINIKENMPIVSDAMDTLKSRLSLAKSRKVKIVVILHGYGSTGVGGAINKAARQWLMSQLRKQVFKQVVFGENFDMYDESARLLVTKYPDLRKYYLGQNHGITILEI